MGLAIRIAVATTDGLWLDELHTAWTIDNGLAGVAARAAWGNQSPIFFWLTWIVHQAVTVLTFNAESPLSFRFVSLIAGCGSLLLISFLVWQWTESRLATLVAVWLAAVDTSMIFYATEARSYALMQLLALVQVWLFWRWLNQFSDAEDALSEGIGHDEVHSQHLISPRRLVDDVRLAVATSLTIFLHPTSFWLIAAETLFVLILFGFDWLQRKSGRKIVDFSRLKYSALVTGLFTLALLVPVMPLFVTLLSSRSNWAPISDWFHLLAKLNLQLRWGLLMPLAFLLVFRAFNGNRRKSSTANGRSSSLMERSNWLPVLVTCWIVVPIVGVGLLDALRWAPMANMRFIQVGMIAFPVMAAVCIRRSPQSWQKLVLTFAILIGSLVTNPWPISAISSGEIPQFRWEDWDSPIREINRYQDIATAPIFLFANLLEDHRAFERANLSLQDYLRFPLNAVPKVDADQRSIFCYPTLDRHPFLLVDLEQASNRRNAWLIVRGDQNLAAEIAFDLIEQLRKYSKEQDQDENWTIRQACFEQSPWNDIKLFFVSLDPNF
jgi:hypothetical protein